tara:strand:- start:155 stop:520 length:366 start_codon:yes stop_codon:yes gene_type:complete
VNLPALLFGSVLITLLHVLVWFSANGQFIKDSSLENFFSNHGLLFAMGIGPIIGALGFYGSRIIYEAMSGSVWQIRFIGFGLSYLVFPILTWVLLGETMLTAKTIVCILLSFLILLIQIYY